MSVQQFMRMSDEKRRKLIVGNDLLTDKEYRTTVSVASQIPALVISKAFFKVVGEKVVSPSSLVQLVVKARFIPPGYTNVPEVNEADLEDVDPDEGDVDAIIGRKSASPKGSKGEKKRDEEEDIQPPLAHAPYFARDHSPRWQIFLADSSAQRVAVPPFVFTTFDKPIFDESGKPTFNMQTLKMQFQAPPQVGGFPFILHAVCDSYLGFDSTTEITLNVEDLAKTAEMAEEDEISEPEEGMLGNFSHDSTFNLPIVRLISYFTFANYEFLFTSLDSLAGQMHAFKTGQAPQPKKKRAAGAEDSSDEDESDTEGEEEDTSETDTDTDTDGE